VPIPPSIQIALLFRAPLNLASIEEESASIEWTTERWRMDRPDVDSNGKSKIQRAHPSRER
jgi:hypothetical protein